MTAGHMSPRLLHHFPPQKRRRSSTCFAHSITFIVILCTVALIFANIVFRAAGDPKLTVEKVSVSKLNAGTTSNMAYLSLTTAATLKLRNSDFGRFRYRSGNIKVAYGNSTIGKAVIKNGLVLGRRSVRINAVMDLKVDDYNVMKDPDFVDDVASNLVKMRWIAELKGDVRAVKIMTIQKTSSMNCSVSLNLRSKVVQDIRC